MMDNLRDVVFQAMGQVSMCWSEVPRGVFDSVQAKKIGEEVMAAIAEHERAALSQAQTAWRLGHPTIIRDANGQEIARMKTTGGGEIETDEQAAQWCRARSITIDLALDGKARLFFQGNLLMEGDTLQEAVAKAIHYSRASLSEVKSE